MMASRFGQVCIIKSVTHGFVLDLFSGMLFSHQEYAGIFSGSYSPDETSQFVSPPKSMELLMSEEGITEKTPCLDI